jgi:hypothetical protein
VLDQALGALDHHLGDLHVARGRLVEGRGDDLAAHGALHVGHFFRPLVDQQHDQVHVRVVVLIAWATFCISMVLPALGGETISARWPLPCGAIRSMMRPVMSSVEPLPRSQREALAREQRRQVLEQHLALGGFQRLAVERVEHVERDVALAVLRAADAAGDFVAGAQVEAADLAGRDVDVVRAGQVAGVGAAQEAVAVGQDFQHAVGGDAVRMAGQHLQQLEGDVLLAHARHALVQAERLGHLEQLVRRHALEVGERVAREIGRQLRPV